MADYTVEVNGVERDALLASVSMQLVANGMDTFSVDFDSEDASFRPELDQEVVILEDGTPMVGGLITSAPEQCMGGPNLDDIVTRVSATSFSIFASFRFVTETIPAGSLESFLTVLATYLTSYGVTLDGAQATGPTLPQLTFTRVRLDEVLNELSKRTDWVWEIDAAKVFRMYAPGSVAAPYDILDTGPVYQVGDVEIEPTRDDTYTNRVILVVTGNGPATATETFVAADGVTAGDIITFTGKYPASQSINDAYPNVLYIDGVAQSVIGFGDSQLPYGDWYWDYTTTPATLKYPISGGRPFPTGAEEITVTYAIRYPFTVIVEDVPAQAPPVGIRERVIEQAEQMTLDAAEEYAQAVLDRSVVTLKRAKVVSDNIGWRPGQSFTINVAKRNTNATFIIQNVSISIAPNSNWMRHVITANEGTVIQGDWRQPYKDWLGDKKGSSGSGGVETTGGAGVGPYPPDKSVQFNRAGAFGGDESFTYDEETNTAMIGTGHTPGASDNLLVGEGHTVN